MGQVREYDFDAVIGIGGIGAEPRSYGIDRKINWVGINAKKKHHALGYSSIITFEHFALFEDRGPMLDTLAPNLAKRMYNGDARILLDGYTSTEKNEAIGIINWVLKNHKHKRKLQKSTQLQSMSGCLRRSCGTHKSRKCC